MEWLTIAIWLIGTLVIATTTCVLAKHYGKGFLIAMFVGSIVVANAVAQKFVEIGPFIITGGVIVYSITFLITDTLAEFWGKKEARRAVWAGFMVYLMFVFTTQIVIQLSAPSFWEGHEAFEFVFGASWRIAVAGVAAYMVAQSHDVWAYHFWKKVTKGKHLWLRNNLSTGTSQIFDSLVFYTAAFAGVVPLAPLIISTILLKFIIAAADTPFMYAIRWYYEKVQPHKKGKPVSIEVPVV